MEKKTFGETLRSLRERQKMSVKTVIEELKRYGQDITDKTLYSYENDKRAASADMLLALCQIYNCNNILETFAGIKPDYSIPDDFEWKIIEKYRSLDPYGQETVNYILDRELERTRQLQNNVPAAIIEFNGVSSPARYIQYFRSASAGGGVFILGNEVTSQIRVSENDWDNRADFVISVSGNSMSPDYNDGDKVLVSQRLEMQYGDVGIFVVNGKAYIKEYGNTELISRNPNADNIKISEYDNIVCMGKVIGKLLDEFEIMNE